MKEKENYKKNDIKRRKTETQRQKSGRSAEEDRRAEGIPGGANMLRLSWAQTHSHKHTQTHTKLFFLTSENPLSRKTVMSLVAGCKKLSLRLCLTLAPFCCLPNSLTPLWLLQ